MTLAVIEPGPGMPIRAACCTVMTNSPRRHPWSCPGTAHCWHERLEDPGSVHTTVLLEIATEWSMPLHEPMDLSSQLGKSGTLQGSCELWGFKFEEGLDRYAHVLNQQKLLVVG